MCFDEIPVIFFTNEIGEIKHIHIDSWKSYNLDHINDIDVTYSDTFSTMFSITPGYEYLYFNFDLNDINETYNFSFPHSKVNNYSKLFVKFFLDDNLELNLLTFANR